MNVRFGGSGPRILDFDCECRPLAWYGGDFVTKQPTAIAWKFIGEPGPVQVRSIGNSYDTRKTVGEEASMIEEFLEVARSADVLTGHFIRAFDLPLLSGAIMRLGGGPFPDVMTSDTKLDFAKRTGLSTSQENLGAMFDLDHPKVPMNTALWAEANMLTPRGIDATRTRVKGDVEQHIEMRSVMLQHGLLASPKMWTAQAKGTGKYHS